MSVLLTSIRYAGVLALDTNHGVFDEPTVMLLRRIYSLPDNALLLLSRLLNRKSGWFRSYWLQSTKYYDYYAKLKMIQRAEHQQQGDRRDSEIDHNDPAHIIEYENIKGNAFLSALKCLKEEGFLEELDDFKLLPHSETKDFGYTNHTSMDNGNHINKHGSSSEKEKDDNKKNKSMDVDSFFELLHTVLRVPEIAHVMRKLKIQVTKAAPVDRYESSSLPQLRFCYNDEDDDHDHDDDDECTNLCNLCFPLFLFIHSSLSISFSFLHHNPVPLPLLTTTNTTLPMTLRPLLLNTISVI